jgi:hypothetical protein
MVIDKNSTEITLKIRFSKNQIRLDFSIMTCSILNAAKAMAESCAGENHRRERRIKLQGEKIGWHSM